MQNTNSLNPREVVYHHPQEPEGMLIKVRAPILKKTTKLNASIDSFPDPTEKNASKKYTPRDKVVIEQSASRIKLRDYLFLAQKSSNSSMRQKRTKENKVIKKQSHETDCTQGEWKQSIIENLQSKSSRKHKYELDNAEMLAIIRKELDDQLTDSFRQLESMRKMLTVAVHDQQNPSNHQMIKMYNLRAMAKEKLKKDIQQMKDLLKPKHNMKHSNVSSEVELEDYELGRDMAIIKEMFSNKYLFQRETNTPSK